MAQKWADTQRVERFGPQTDRFRSPRPEEQNTVSIIQNLLDKFINPEAAAHIIATIYEPRLLKGEKISVWPFTLLSRAIIYPETTAENHQHIAEMLVCLSKLPDVIVDGRPLKENGRTYWRDIPEFGIWFAECALNVHRIEDIDLGNCPVNWQEQAQQYKSANGFAALYLSTLTPSITCEWRGMQCAARNTLTEALEVEMATDTQVRRAGIYIPAAAQWLLHSASLIWDFCKKKELYSGDVERREWIGGSDGSKALWKGDDGFSVERWAFWKERFEYAAVLPRKRFAGRVVNDVVMWAREAVQMMHAAEQDDAVALDGFSNMFE